MDTKVINSGSTRTLAVFELKVFLQRLLEKPDLRVHTAISQVLENPRKPSEFIAYYSVRHYKGQPGQAAKFAVFGWYSFTLQNDVVVSLKINVTALEGNSSVLAYNRWLIEDEGSRNAV